MSEFIRIIWLFYIYSFIGWLWETVYCSIKAGHFVYRGFLIGPITPIYGFGILGVLYLVEPFQYHIVILYVLSSILVTLLEYVTSYGLEKLFNATLWDYHDVPFNINGRVAIPVSMFWGIGCVFIVRFLHPRVLLLEGWLADHFGMVLPLLLVGITIVDLVYTVVNMASFKKVTAELENLVAASQREFEAKREEGRAALAETVEETRERLSSRVIDLQEDFQEKRTTLESNWVEYLKHNKELQRLLPKYNFNQRRILMSFPNLKVKTSRDIKAIQDYLIERKQKR